jgi:long-chain acyl-CoA synthetase
MIESPEGTSQVWTAFRQRALRHPDKTVVEADGQSLTFRQLLSASEEAAGTLQQSGVRSGSVVGLLLPNCSAFLPLFLAACKASAATALFPVQLGALELRTILESIPIHSLLTVAGQVDRLAGQLHIREEKPLATSHFGDSVRQIFPCMEVAKIVTVPADTAQDLAPHSAAVVYKFTSGSTGKPKGVALSAANLLAEAENVVSTLELTSKDRIFAPVPLAHSYGFDLGVLAALASGATLVLHSAFVPRRALAELINGATVFLGVPSMYRAMLETRLETQPDLGRVRYLLSCTAPLNPEVIGAFHERFRAPICQHYGSSEAGAVANHVNSEVMRRPTSVGRAMNNVEVRIVDEQGQPVSAGIEGHVVVRSPAVARGYVLGAPSGPSPLRNGEFRMGDFGVLDVDGFLEVRGRSDQMINVGGLKVWPEEIMRTLESHPAVHEAVVFGVRDSNGEYWVGAAVAVSDGVDEAQLQSFCQARLAPFKVPRRIEIRRELRRGPTGKAILGFEGQVS